MVQQMNISKDRLIELLRESTSIKVFVCESSPGDADEHIAEGPLTEVLLQQDGTLELWYNTGYEI